MNYADLFRVTLPETVLEIAALLVLVVDLAFLRKTALKVRVYVAALLGVTGCGAALALKLKSTTAVAPAGSRPNAVVSADKRSSCLMRVFILRARLVSARPARDGKSWPRAALV